MSNLIKFLTKFCANSGRYSASIRNSYLILAYLFLYLPIFLLIAFSFNKAIYSLKWHGFTFIWYKNLLNNHEIWVTAWHSLLLGICAATLATVLGTLAAINLYRYHFLGKKLLHALLFILLIVPDLILGIALLILFNYLQLSLGFFSLLLAHTTLCLPFVAITVYTTLKKFDPHLFESAKDLGANENMIFKAILFPLLWPALLGSWLLAFTLSLDDVVISYFVSGTEFDILPLKIFAMARMGVKPDLNALCAIMLGITILLVFFAYRLNRRAQTLGEK